VTPVIDSADIESFRAIVVRRLGLKFDDGNPARLVDVLRQRMEATDSPRFESYVNHLTTSPRPELAILAERLTVTETFFFRNADNLRAFSEVVLPGRVRARPDDKRLRILSAGCASGEEPYSLAILVREALPDLAAWDVKITGIDINPAMLAKARQARYTSWSLRATSQESQRRYFRRQGDDFVLDPAIQKMVTFEERNLVDQDPLFWQSLACDVVFCRNVLMYFAPDQAEQVVQRIAQALLPGGFLFLGHTDTLRLANEFVLCQSRDTFYYRRGGREPDSHAVGESTGSWVDVIARASERIGTLADGAAPPAVARSWDLGPVVEAVKEERFSDALDLITALPPGADDDPDALLLRAVLLTNNGKLVESEAVCKRLLALDGLNAGAHYVMALCREHASDATGAIQHDQAAIHLDASFAMPHLHLGIMAKRAGDVVTARRDLGQALILLARENDSRVLLFGGGFSRETLLQLSRTELRAAGGRG
jgi:chemotaxis protein methyltransferase CheR